jgi:hypothetical protein
MRTPCTRVSVVAPEGPKAMAESLGFWVVVPVLCGEDHGHPYLQLLNDPLQGKAGGTHP